MELTVADVFAAPKVRAVLGLLWQMGDLVRRAIHKYLNKKLFKQRASRPKLTVKCEMFSKNKNSDLYSQICFGVSGFT